MTRTRLPDKRFSVNLPVTFRQANDRETQLSVTIGYEPGTNRIREVFCSDFKTGSDYQALVVDACILLSHLLQHGVPPADLAAAMCTPPSLIGTIVGAIVREEALEGVD